MRNTTLLCLTFAASAWAQVGRDSYRVPYQTWRQTAPALEQEAATPGPTFGPQVQASAQAAEAFFKARAAYLAATQPQAEEQAKWTGQSLPRADALLATPSDVQQLLAVTAARVATNIGAFASDKDPVIRQVRQAMERERAALRALTDALTTRKSVLTELINLTDEAEVQRDAVNQALTSSIARRKQLVEHIGREAEDWAAYYKNLAEGATGGLRSSNTGGAAGLAGTVGDPNVPSPARITRPATNGQMPLSRYTGEWIFPSKGLFYGPQPEDVELAVQEADGIITGKLTARFALPAGSREDPALKLEFQGPVQESKIQTFELRTSDAAVGMIEIIPGSAFNLLEVNIQVEPRPGKISSANFILVKR